MAENNAMKRFEGSRKMIKSDNNKALKTIAYGLKIPRINLRTGSSPVSGTNTSQSS